VGGRVFFGVDGVGHFAGGDVVVGETGVFGGALLEVAVEGAHGLTRDVGGLLLGLAASPASFLGNGLENPFSVGSRGATRRVVGWRDRGCSRTRGAGALDPRLMSVAPCGAGDFGACASDRWVD
jgi:hypothetical protein